MCFIFSIFFSIFFPCFFQFFDFYKFSFSDKGKGKKKVGSRSSTSSSSRSSTPTKGTENQLVTSTVQAAAKKLEGRPGTPSEYLLDTVPKIGTLIKSFFSSFSWQRQKASCL